jgi:hypothetical protein
VLRLFDNTVDAVRRPEIAIDILARVASGCTAVSSLRPASDKIAPLLLALCNTINQHSISLNGSNLQAGFDFDLSLPSAKGG